MTMETKTLRPFDLEAAKAGAPVVTRDGRPVRILCTDCKDNNYPIVALINNSGEESVCTFTASGKCLGTGIVDHCYDLFIVPTKRQGWVNVFHGTGDRARVRVNEAVFSKKEIAEEVGKFWSDYVATVAIEWEE